MFFADLDIEHSVHSLSSFYMPAYLVCKARVKSSDYSGDQNNSIEILRVKVLKILYKSKILIFWHETCSDSFIYRIN